MRRLMIGVVVAGGLVAALAGLAAAQSQRATLKLSDGSVAVDKAGVGSAVLNSMRQVGGSLGVAIMGAILGSYISVGAGTPGHRRQVIGAGSFAGNVASERRDGSHVW